MSAFKVRLTLSTGPIVRVGPNHVIISDPTSIRRVLAPGSTFTRGPRFDTLRLHPEKANVILEREPAKHQRLRRIIGLGGSAKTALPTSMYLRRPAKVPAAVPDPKIPSQLAPDYNSGDYLHPSVKGYQRIADMFPIEIFGQWAGGADEFM
ncbi:hypothetical protein DM02DRAFT_659417 [Periconia macrospinosa]|uniref:Cytochrome P450 n=1 Tax=Periconia macrospinosa TaxID=97972 RepID=A0A2V1DDQ7_9PLEO|nr:hypothetical protein DM02DRAFT_659417 [Periconia macrospinosa]